LATKLNDFAIKFELLPTKDLVVTVVAKNGVVFRATIDSVIPGVAFYEVASTAAED